MTLPPASPAYRSQLTIDGDLPVLADVVRSGVVEGHHRGSAVALDADGALLVSAGVVDEPVFPRSSFKPLQAVALLQAGADLTPEQVALACASHSGEPRHIEVVLSTLASVGLDAGALGNTPGLPLDLVAQAAVLRGGGEADPLHMNCSGKHAAMLATCVSNGWGTSAYTSPDHPLQQAVRATIEDLCGEAVTHVAVDGCGAPLFSVSLTGLARAFARIATSPSGTPEERVAAAMRAHPWLVGGTGREVTRLMESVPGAIAKDGAEGVFAVGLADGRAAAVKVDDGAARAAMPVLFQVLAALGVDVDPALATTPVLGGGQPVGGVTGRSLHVR